MNDKKFIEELKFKREEYRVSQKRLAVACGISREHYNRIETGKLPLTEELKAEIQKQLERLNPLEPMFILVDYFRVRFPTTDPLTVIKDILHIKPRHMLHEEYGRYGYEELYFCIYEKAKEQYVKKGIAIEDSEIKNRFEIRMKNERAYKAVVDLLTYYDAERTAFSIINHYIRFVDSEEDKPKNRWKINPEWAYFVGDNRVPIRLTTQPEPFTMERALHWLQRQVAPTLKMVQELDKMNHTTIMDDMLEHTELKDKHRHLLELEKTTIEERIDTAVSKETDGIF
jgi:transcriptional regulator with XRE-family HTH domain